MINLNAKVSSVKGYVVIAIAVVIFLGVFFSAQVIAKAFDDKMLLKSQNTTKVNPVK